MREKSLFFAPKSPAREWDALCPAAGRIVNSSVWTGGWCGAVYFIGSIMNIRGDGGGAEMLSKNALTGGWPETTWRSHL